MVAARIYKPDYPFVLNRASQQAVGLVLSGAVGMGAKLMDVSGYGHHGTITGSSWAPGQDGGNSALLLNGSSDFVSFGALPITGDCTASVWLKTTSALSGTKLMFGNWIQGSSSNYGLFYWDAGNTNNGAEFISASTFGAVFNGSYNDGRWHLFTGTTTAAATAFYVDGRRVATSVGYSGISNTGFAWQMGSGTAQWFLGGTFENPNVWRRAFNPTEAWSLFDPRTRWDLRYKLGRKKFLLPAATTTTPNQLIQINQAVKAAAFY